MASLPHAGSQSPTLPLHTYRDEVYAFDVQLGTPPQILRLAIDVMGVGTVVAGNSCESCLNTQKSVYDENVSSTALYNGGRHGHDDGSVDVGIEDVMKTLDLASNAFTFHEIISAPPTSCFIHQPFDGVIGLQSKALSPNIFGLHMNRICANADDFADGAGSITHGGFAWTACEGGLWTNVPLENFEGSSLLSIKLDSLYDAHVKRAPFQGPWRATFTTTSPDLILPAKLFADLNEHWGAQAMGGLWTIDCNTQHSITLDYKCMPLTPDNLTIGCNVLGPMALQQFIYRVGNICVLRIRPRDEDDTYPDYWTLGVAFLRQFCVGFNFEGARG
ncbi:Vacuolar aspartic protease [Aphelenchoides avenae]|nr:Vacuolar aspartic protease [Aphelenchus avenae]